MVDFFEALAEMSEVVCVRCGQATSAYAPECESCGSPTQQDAEPTLTGLNKVPVQESRNLSKIARAMQGLQEGTLAPEDYLAEVEEVLAVADSALELYASAFMQHRMATMEAGPAVVYRTLCLAAQEMQTGLEAMLNYTSPAQLVQGFQQFEAGLWQVDRAQDLAIEGATQLILAGEV